MLLFFLIILSIWFNHLLLINNEMFILGVFLIMFFLLIYIFLSYLIKFYFFSNVNYILNLLKYSNTINSYLDKILYYNIIVKNIFLKNLLDNKKNIIKILNFLNKKINNFLFFNIIKFFLILKKNLLKLFKNKKLLILKNNMRICEIIL